MQTWGEIAKLGRLAPTPHNTQPFRIRPLSETEAELVLVTRRLLPEEDHGNLYVASSLGVFAVALEHAAREQGWALEVTPAADLNVSTLHERGPTVVMGRAKLVGKVAAEPAKLLHARRTSRLPYHDRAVDPAALAALTKVLSRFGHRFISYGEADVVEPLLRLNAEAIIDNLQLDQERDEIEKWYRLGETPPFGDGLWKTPMNQPAWELWSAFAFPWAFQLPFLREFAVERYLLTQRGTRHIALLCGSFRSWPELYTAGRALFDFWLELQRHDLYMQPMGSMLTHPKYVAEIAKRFGQDDCWLVVRLGYSDAPPRAPRLENILLHE